MHSNNFFIIKHEFAFFFVYLQRYKNILCFTTEQTFNHKKHSKNLRFKEHGKDCNIRRDYASSFPNR